MTALTRYRGFTLFEMLIATAILAVITAMAYSGLIQVEDARQQLHTNESRLAELQMTFLNFERDLQQVVHRPVRNQYGTVRPSIAGQGEYLMELTRGGYRNPAHVARSTLQRVAYIIEDNRLERLSWYVLDQAQDSEPVRQVLLDKVKSVEIRFLDQSQTWSVYWPSQEAEASGAGQALPDSFPRAVSVKLELDDVGTIERIIPMPEG